MPSIGIQETAVVYEHAGCSIWQRHPNWEARAAKGVWPVAVFLATEADSSYIVGAIVGVTGGGAH